MKKNSYINRFIDGDDDAIIIKDKDNKPVFDSRNKKREKDKKKEPNQKSLKEVADDFGV